MPLSKHFIRPKFYLDDWILIIGIAIGTGYSFGLYGLLYGIREIFRICASTLGEQALLELSAAQNFYYNLFFSSIACVFGFYACIKFIFENQIDHQVFKVRLRQRETLANHSFFSWTFLYLFVRISTLIGVGYITWPIGYDLSFVDEYPYLLILLPFVLFLYAWLPLLRITGNYGYKLMGLSFLYICTLSLIYANWNMADYKKINRNLRLNSVELTYKLNTPKSLSHQVLYRRSLVEDLYVVIDTTNSSNIILFWNNAKGRVVMEDIKKYVQNARMNIPDFEYNQLVINLHIDERVSLEFVNDLKQLLRKIGIRRVQYSTGVMYSKYPSYYPPFKRVGIQEILPRYYHEFEFFLDSAERLDLSKYRIILPESSWYRVKEINKYNRIELRVDEKKAYLNGEDISDDEISKVMYGFVKRFSPEYLIIYSPDEHISYGRYIEYLDMINFTIDQLREQMSQDMFEHSYDEWDFYGKTNTIERKYPRAILEWTFEEKRLLQLLKK
ncbi:MAG: hypothetical protein WAU36_08055 [Cyclobacteriaceae bacterium]